MARVNVFLLLAILVCALGLVTSQHEARRLFQTMDAEQERARQLDVEFDRLQLELSTWATSPRIERIARENLKMQMPDAARIVTASSSAPAAGGTR